MLQGHVNTKNNGKVYVFGQLGDDNICFVSTNDALHPVTGYSVIEMLFILKEAVQNGVI